MLLDRIPLSVSNTVSRVTSSRATPSSFNSMMVCLLLLSGCDSFLFLLLFSFFFFLNFYPYVS